MVTGTSQVKGQPKSTWAQVMQQGAEGGRGAMLDHGFEKLSEKEYVENTHAII